MSGPSRGCLTPRAPILVGVFLFGILGGWGADWPQFLGPNRDGATSQRLVNEWPKDGPTLRWKVPVGSGFSGPIITSNSVVLFDRTGDEERLRALDVASGRPIWESRAPTAYVDSFGFDNGPRSTPCATAGHVITYGAEGRLRCVTRAEGKVVWTVEAGRDLGADRGFFGPACSPLVLGNRVFLNLGNTGGGGVAAFDLTTGKLLWKTTDHEAGYASPVPEPAATGASASLVWFFTREGLVGMSPEGTQRFSHTWRSRQHASVNAASPLVRSNEVFLTSSYDTGAVLLRSQGDRLKVVWSGDESLSAHYATPVAAGAFIYGFHGRQEQGTEFRCVEWATGKVRWSEPNIPAGTVALAKDQLVILLESGELLVAPADAAVFKPIGRVQVLGRVVRAPFAMAGNILVARDSRQLVCLAFPGGAAQP